MKVLYYPVKFGGQRHSSNRGIMVLVCNVTLQDHMTRVLYNFMVKISPNYVIIIPSLVATDIVVLEL